uniref:EGF-like domain-containing protein n=1 Tax=Panagrolaimus davidi TaxID=227884 RepID=A0A914PG45_9BILA
MKNKFENLQSQITPKSDIYVFTLSPPSDYSTTDPYTESSTTAESILSRTVINWGHSVYTILGQSALSPFNETDPAINAFQNIAAISNGEFIYVASRTSDAARAFQSIFALNLYPETVASQRNFNCSTPVSVSITNGAYDTGIFIYTSGTGIIVTYNGAALTANATYGDFQVFNQGYADSRATITIGGAPTCSYRIFTSSLESVIPGFAATAQVDISKSYPSAYIPVFPVARIVSSSPPNLLHFYAVSQSGDALLSDGGESQNVRSDCNFPFQFQSWNCSERAFFSKFTYTESSGTTTRMIPSVCFTPIYRDPVDIPLTCNGGTVNRNNNTCSCPPYQSGQYCEIYQCQNGGTVNPFPVSGGPKCLCQDGFSGSFCESLSCTSMSPRPDTSKKAVNFVVQATNSLSSFINQIQGAAKSIASFSMNPGYFDNFVLTTFINKTSGDVSVNTQAFNNVTLFLSAVDNMEGGSSDLGQYQNPFTALLSTLNASVAHPWRQSLFLFVDAPPSDTDIIDLAISSAINLATSVNVVLTKPFGLLGDDTVTCITDFSAYQKVADTTGGIFVNLCDKSDNTSVQTFVSNLGQYHYNLETVSREQVSCSSTVTKVLEQNDGIATRLVFLTFNGDFNFNVTLNGVTQSSTVTIPAVRMYKLSLPTSGNYTLVINPLSPLPLMTCGLVVGEQTGQTILAGFASNPSIDYSSFAAQYGIASYPTLFMSTQLQSPPTVTLSFTNNGSTYSSIGVMRNASSCQFDYFFNQPFGCPTPGEAFTINARFTTDDGISFNRAIQSICQAPAPGTCLNGGYFDSGNDCACPPGIHGVYCEQRYCYNGGTFDQDMCKCLPNFGGLNCEVILCDKWDYLETYDNNFVAYETIAFLVNTRLTSLSINLYLTQYITDFINAVHSNSQAKQFILVTFDNLNVNKIISTTDEMKFIQTFQDTVSKPPKPPQQINGTADVIGAVYETLRLITYKPAMLFLFSSGDVSSPANFMTVNNMLGKGGVQINIILQSGKTTLPTGGNWGYYQQLAISSSGRIISLTDAGNVKNLMQTALPSAIYEGVIVEDRTYASCAVPQITFFPVEYRSKWFSIFIAGDRANYQSSYVQIWDASDTLIDNPSDYLTLDDSGSMWYHFPATATQNYAGYWKIQVETASPKGCQIQIRANTPLQTSLGFTTVQSTDFPYANPFVVASSNKTRFITASVSSSLYQQSDAFLEYLKVSTLNPDNGTLTLVGGSALAYRDYKKCAYQFVTPQITIPSTFVTTAIQIQINGQDERGNNFQQIHWYLNQAASCSNGATKDAYGLCVCSINYTGDECDIPVCQNGGTADMVVCQCPSGYYGDFCQNALLSGNVPTTTSTTTTPGTTASATTMTSTTTASTTTTATVPPPPVTTTTPTIQPPITTSTISPTPGDVTGQPSTPVVTTTSPGNPPSSSVPPTQGEISSTPGGTPTEGGNPSTPPSSSSSSGGQTTTTAQSPGSSESPVSSTAEPTTSTSPSGPTVIVTNPSSSSAASPASTTTNAEPNPTTTMEVPTTPSSESTVTTTSGSLTTRTTMIPQPCNNPGVLNVYLSYFVDTGNGFGLYDLYKNILSNTSAQPIIGNPTRFISIYGANANGTNPDMLNITDTTAITNQFVNLLNPPYFTSSTSSVIDDLTFYQSVLTSRLTSSKTPVTPVIVMFLNNPIDDLSASTAKMNAVKNANPSTHFMGVLLSTDPTNSQLPFDYIFNATVADNTAPLTVVKQIFDFICQVTQSSF